MENHFTNPGSGTLLFNAYAYYLPLVLYTVWTTIVLIDIGKRPDLTVRPGILWMLAVFLIPFVAPSIYLWSQTATISRRGARLLLTTGATLLGLVLLLHNLL